MSKNAARLAAALLLVVATAGADAAEPAPDDQAAGMLVAVTRDGRALGACPLTHTDVAVDVAGFVARVVVTQRFENRFAEPIEAVYTFPLSARAAVDDMWMRSGDRVIHADLRRREEARRAYEAARAAGRTASLLDEERPNVFTQSLANLMPGTAVEIELRYVEPLVFADGAFELVFPTVVGPRFVPGAATGRSGGGFAPDTDRVPDGSRVTPPVVPKDTRAGHDVAIAVDLDAGMPIGDLVAPLHAVDIERPDPTRARVALSRRAEIPNRDFVLRWTVAGDRVRSAALVHRAAAGDGYLSVMLVPTREVGPATAAPKELVFLIDRSGSQAGAPLAKAKETLLWILDHMHPDDTFQVVDFGSDSHVLFDRPERATPAMKARARTYIEALEANGGTMMAEAVRRVCALPADDHRLRIVTFMTDGYVGNDLEVLGLVRELRGTTRWFAFGTGNSVNRFLLDGIAREGGGESEIVLLNDPGTRVAERFWKRIGSPVLTDVRVGFEDLDVGDVEPRALGDVWAERPLLVHARYRAPGRGRVVLSGFQQGRPYRETLEVTLPAVAPAHAGIASTWARARVDSLLREDLAALQRGTFPEELRERVVAIALAHRLLTPFTSFVAVEERVVNEGGRLRTVTVPVEMPDGVSHEGVFGGPASTAEAQAGLPAAAGVTAAALAPALRQAPLAESARAKSVDEAEPRLRRETDLAPPPTDARDAAVPVEPPPARRGDALGVRARTRLAPALVAALTAATPAPADPVRVRVTIVGDRRAARRALRAAGFARERAASATPDVLVGTIPLARLAALAELACVERIEPADPAGSASPAVRALAGGDQLGKGLNSSDTPKTSVRRR